MIFIGVPHTGYIRAELAMWLMKQTAFIELSNARPIDENRNRIVQKFLTTDATHLFMVDSDIIPPLNVLEMAKHDVPVVAAHAVTIKGVERIPVGLVRSEGGGYHHDFKHSKPGLHKVDVVGTGCICIRRDVLENMDPPWFQFGYKDGFVVQGEDFDFSEKVGDVYYDARYRCDHWKEIPLH